jgi:hypothetical protein
MQVGRDERNSAEFKTFCRQLFHECLAFIFSPLKPWMITPKVVKCPDGYYRRAIFGLGPYIADYPEQVWLSAIVSGWCPKCVYNMSIFLFPTFSQMRCISRRS